MYSGYLDILNSACWKFLLQQYEQNFSYRKGKVC